MKKLKGGWHECQQREFAFLHTCAHVDIHTSPIALFGVPADFSPLEWIAWKQVTDERMDTQSYKHTLTARGELWGYGALRLG